MKKHAVIQNTLWLIGGRFVRMVISMMLGMLTARYLGPSDYGLLNHAAAYTGFFCSVCNLGLDGVLTRELTDAPEKSGEILGTALVLRGISSILSSVAILCIVSVVDRHDTVMKMTVLLLSLGMVAQTVDFLQYWFQSRLQSGVTMKVMLASSVVVAGYKLYLLCSGKPVLWFASSSVLEQLLTAKLLFSSYRRSGGSKLKFSREMAGALFRKSCHFILPGLMVAIYAQTDKIMLGHMIGETEIGYYTAAGSICNAWCFVLTAVIESLYPQIIRVYRQASAVFDRRNRQLYSIVFYISLAVSVLLCLGAKPLVRFLYGDAYIPAAKVLCILTWHTGFSYLGVARNPWMVCKNKQQYLLWCYASAAVGNVTLNFLLVPWFGAAGAAVASLAAQVITTMVVPFLIPQLRENGKLMLEAMALCGIFSKRDGG